MSCLFTVVALTGLLCGPATAVDGDTLRMGSERVRLWGVDAEEMSERNGPWAKEILSSIVAGKTVECLVLTRDNYGRAVARCHAGSTYINKKIIARGAALDCRRYSGGAFASVEPVGARTKLSQKPYCRG